MSILILELGDTELYYVSRSYARSLSREKNLLLVFCIQTQKIGRVRVFNWWSRTSSSTRWKRFLHFWQELKAPRLVSLRISARALRIVFSDFMTKIIKQWVSQIRIYMFDHFFLLLFFFFLKNFYRLVALLWKLAAL